MSRRPLSQSIYAPVNTLLMIPALAVLGFYTFVGLAFEPKQVELNALLWGLGALSFVSVTKAKNLPTVCTTAFSLFIARLVIDYSKSNPLSVILEVALLILLTLWQPRFSRTSSQRVVDEQVSDSPLYWALGLQVFLTLVTWAVPADYRILWCWYSASL